MLEFDQTKTFLHSAFVAEQDNNKMVAIIIRLIFLGSLDSEVKRAQNDYPRSHFSKLFSIR